MRAVLFAPVMVLSMAITPGVARAQSAAEPRYDIGGFVGAIDFREATFEKPFALGVRFAVRATEFVAVEAELNACPEDPSGNFGQSLVAAGPRVGVRAGPVHVAGRVLLGSARFYGRGFRAQNPDVGMKPVVNVGGLFELISDSGVGLRVDVGDAIVPFGSTVVRSPLPPHDARPGTTHNRYGWMGITFRF